jgi:hypothetical protein
MRLIIYFLEEWKSVFSFFLCILIPFSPTKMTFTCWIFIRIHLTWGLFKEMQAWVKSEKLLASVYDIDLGIILSCFNLCWLLNLEFSAWYLLGPEVYVLDFPLICLWSYVDNEVISLCDFLFSSNDWDNENKGNGKAWSCIQLRS